MNRYESAYRDYTTMPRGAALAEPDDESGGGGGAYPQRPERSKRNVTGPVAGRVLRQKETMSDSSAESYDPSRPYTAAGQANRGFSSTDDEQYYHHDGQHQHQLGRHHHISSRELSDRSGGERSNTEFVVANDAIQAYPRSPSLGSVSDDERRQQEERYYQEENERSASADHEVPEIYIPQPEYLTRMPTSELSQGSYRTYRTAPHYEDATLRSKTSKRGGIVIESMRAPHPMCPNTRSCCCLMLLFNLGLLLVCLGFVIVLQLNDPPFVWYLGVFMLVFGFVSLIIGLVFCAWMCREGSPDAPLPPNSELYWTHHWRKTIYLPETHGRIHETQVKTPIDDVHYLDESDSYSGGAPEPNQRYHHQNNAHHHRY